MGTLKVLLYSKQMEVTAGLFSVLTDFFDVDVAENTETAGEACRREKYALMTLHSSLAVADAVEEYQTLVAVCPGMPCLYLAEDATLVDFALKSFHPPAAAALSYPLTSPGLISAMEKVLSGRLRRKPLERVREERKYPLVVILSSGGEETITARKVLEKYCEIIIHTSTLEALRYMTKRKLEVSAILVSPNMKKTRSTDPEVLEAITRIREISPGTPIGMIAWTKNDIKKASRQWSISESVVLSGQEGFQPLDLVRFLSRLIGKELKTQLEGEDSRDKKKKRVLVVDDEKGIRGAIEMVLTPKYDVLLAADGQSGIALFKSEHQKIDLVLLDMKLPDMNGAQILFEMKKIDRSVPIIMVTGAEGAGMAARSLYLGIAGYIMKPIGAAQLEEVVADAIHEKERTRMMLTESKKLLVIDDSEETAELFRLLFLDYRVDAALTGRSGIETFRREKYDVVALDYRMPDIMGDKVLHELKSIDKSTRVIAVTIERDAGVAKKLIEEGVERVLYKPLKREEVEAAVRGGGK